LSWVTRIIVTTVALLLAVVATTSASAVARTYDATAVGTVDESAYEAGFTATTQQPVVWAAPTAASLGQLDAATMGSAWTGCTYDACRGDCPEFCVSDVI
jgi:hypothetical protein